MSAEAPVATALRARGVDIEGIEMKKQYRVEVEIYGKVVKEYLIAAKSDLEAEEIVREELEVTAWDDVDDKIHDASEKVSDDDPRRER